MLRLIAFILLIVSFKIEAYDYAFISRDPFTSIHTLTINPNEYCITPVRANGRETVRSLAIQHAAIAAVNGGFWESDGTPAGILKINHVWHGMPIKNRGAIGWNDCGKEVFIDRLLTSDYGEIIPYFSNPKEWENLEHIVGGSPLLVFKGNIIEDFSPEQTLQSFILKRHARTAVGIQDNGNWVFVVVDKAGFAGGMTIREMAEFMLNLGCINSLNLDGGSSSTMVIEQNVINTPFGKVLEKGKFVEAVSDAILIYKRGT